MVMLMRLHHSIQAWILKNSTEQRPTIACWLKDHYQFVWCLCVVLCTLPAVFLYWDYLNNDLGANPLQALQKKSGELALIFLIVTLSITPLRRSLTSVSIYVHARWGKRLSDWNWIIRLRRTLGLYSYYYVLLHLWVWLHLDIDYDWISVGLELTEKPYLAVGLVSFLLMTPLALTSNNRMMVLLGKQWQRLHRLIYLLSLLVLLHYWLSMRPGEYPPWFYTITITLLLFYRVISYFGWGMKKIRNEGMIVAEC